MRSKRLLAKRVLSWFIVALGILLGFLGLSISGQRWLPDPNIHPDWFRPYVQTAGIGLLGLTFLTASLVALRNRRRAGLVFLVCTPIVAFCLAFPDAGFIVWEGGGLFYSPLLSTALGLGLLFFVPFLLPLFAIQNRRRAIYLFLISAAVVSPVFVTSRWTASLLPKLAAWSALFVVFGLFWLGTHKLGWPALVATRPISVRRRLASAVIGCVLVVTVDLTAMFALTAWQSGTLTHHCDYRGGLFAEPVFPGHTVFTARMIRVSHRARVSGKWAGDWAIARVQDRFWGLPSMAPHFVFLTDGLFWEGETYFIDGRRAQGFLTRHLPIVEARPCGRSGPLVDTTLELRVLREEPPASGTRIVGFVRKHELFVGGLTPPAAHTSIAGAKISVTGPSGITVVTTDQEGIYEVNGLPPDNYRLRLALPDSQIAPDNQVEKRELIGNRLSEQDFQVDWNGTIEGSVRDASGGAAHARLVLKKDGTDPLPVWDLMSDKAGFFRIGEIPPGRYILMLNPYGPSEGSPYAPQYYPSAVRPEDAHIFEIAEGQHIKNIDCVLSHLAEKKVQVRVTWPNGQPVKGARIYVAYERTRQFESLREASSSWRTNHSGIAEMKVFVNSRIRVYAEQLVDDVKAPQRYSVPAEFEANRVPRKFDLVVSSSELPRSR